MMDFEALLKLSREEVDARMAQRFGLSDPYYREPMRDAAVVQAFLQRICPIQIPEADATAGRLSR
jgi:hypothetical protein